MCPQSCVAYTGPFTGLDSCLFCNQPCFDDAGNPRQKFYTLSIGPQIQALKQHLESVTHMDYFWSRTQELLPEFNERRCISELDDFCCGTDILNAVWSGLIKEHDTILIMSFDGCQLYRIKVSDCWIYIWILGNLSPTL